MHKILLVASLILFSPLAFSKGLRGEAELLNPKGYSIFAQGSMFTSSGSYDEEGIEIATNEGDEFKLMDLDFAVSYGFSSNLEGTFSVRARNVSSTSLGNSASNSGLESVSGEMKYIFPKVDKTTYGVGVYYRQTMYTNEIYSTLSEIPVDELVLGDSGSEYGINLLMTYNRAPYKINGKFGYRSPANNLSEEIIYKLEGVYQWTSLSAVGGVEGIYSLNNDAYAETPTLKPIQATGSSRLFNSINREKIVPYGGFYYQFDKLLAGLVFNTVMSGQSTDKGSSMMFNLRWDSPGVTPEAVKINSFKEYSVDGSVLKVSARGNFLKIDQGLSTDVEKGMKFDIYQTDYFGGNLLVASGTVYEVGADWSVIKLTKKYKEIVIKPGFAARGY